MEEVNVTRKLEAILYADVVGYSRLTGADEEGTHRTVANYLDVIAELVSAHGGRVVHYAGDAVLADFASVTAAVECAVDVQKELANRNVGVSEDRKVQFRIGVNLGDVIVDRDDIFGNGVNVAARLEALADPGGICVSSAVFEQVKRKLGLRFEDLGPQRVKNIAEPVRVYQLLMGPRKTGILHRIKRTNEQLTIVMAAVVLIIVGGIAFWQVKFQTVHPSRPAFAGPSIAVLPFANLSGDPMQDYFADGITDDLITDLSKISGLVVIARNSSFMFKEKPVDVQMVARELGVKYVLEGSTRRVDQQVRVNAQLIDAATGGHLWAARYDDTMTNIFVLQDKITHKIVAALSVELTAGEKERISRKDTDSIDAYDAFLLGWEHYLRSTPEDLTKAVSHLNEAVTLDPDFARAHAALAEAYQRSIARGWWRTWGIERWEVKEKLQHHLQMAEREPMAYHAKSRMLLRARKHDEAIAELERALAIDPNNFLVHIAMAWALSLSGRPEDAVDYAEKAMRLDPRQQRRALWQLGLAQFGMEQFEAAVTSLKRAIKLGPKMSQWTLMAAYGQLGRMQEAADTRKAYFNVRGWKGTNNVSTTLNYYPYKRHEDEARFDTGLLAAGVPGYYKISDSTKLTGAEIRTLVFGRTRTGRNILSGQQFWITYAEDGRATRRGGQRGSDTGKAWIEGDKLCEQWQRSRKGRKRCVSLYRNRQGTRDALDEYLVVAGTAVVPVSVID